MLLEYRPGACEATAPVDSSALRECFNQVIHGWSGMLEGRALRGLEKDGDVLFQTVFPVGEARSLFDEAVATWPGVHPLRLRFVFEVDNPELQWLERLPWEILYWDRGKTFLSLDARFSLVRSLRVPFNVPRSHPGTLRCLAAAPLPTGVTPLDLMAERDAVQQELSAIPELVFEMVPSPTLSATREALLASKAQIFHFMGHGFRSRRDEGFEFGLVFEDEFGRESRISAQGCAEWLQGLGAQLVVLNACQTAAESTQQPDQPFHGVAQRLIRAGIPAVVAMRHPIGDRAARGFARMFYRRLTKGDSMEQALIEARLEMRRQDPERHRWITPAFFLRTADSWLLEAPAPNREPAAAAATSAEPDLEIDLIRGDGTEVVADDLQGSLTELAAAPLEPPPKGKIRAVEGDKTRVVLRRLRNARES